jgi:hypothetical protein
MDVAISTAVSSGTTKIISKSSGLLNTVLHSQMVCVFPISLFKDQFLQHLNLNQQFDGKTE